MTKHAGEKGTENTFPFTKSKISGKFSGSTEATIESKEVDCTYEELEVHIKELEEKMDMLGDDAQMANLELQNMLQKHQQTLQMMINIYKMLHDTALSVIRKIG